MTNADMSLVLTCDVTFYYIYFQECSKDDNNLAYKNKFLHKITEETKI